MKKQFFNLSIIMAAIIMIFAGCANPLMPVVDDAATAGNQNTGSGLGAITISVDSGTSSRTILPTTPSFTKYRLEFSGPGTVDPVEDTSTTFDTVYLDPGEWTVTAYGYADFDGSEVEVAQGSGTVTVTAGSAGTLLLYIEAAQTGGTPGTFDYTVTVPEALNGLVDAFDISYHPYGDSSSPVSDSGAISYSGSGFSYNSSADMEPGYYLVTVSLSSGSYSATRMEILHIYSNMTSTGSFDFDESDIMPLVTLSGSLEILNMGVAQDESGWIVEAFTSPDFADGTVIGGTLTDGSSNWSMLVETQNPATEIYFRAMGLDDNADMYTRPVISSSAVVLEDSDITGIALSENIGQITVSGTLSYTADGVAGTELENWNIAPYIDDYGWFNTMNHYQCQTDASGNWSFTIEESELEGSSALGFHISNVDLGVEFYDGSAIPAEFSDISQELSLELITLSGDISHTIDGTVQTDYSQYWLRAQAEEDNRDTTLGSCLSDAAGNWSMLVPASADNRDLYFSASNGDIGYDHDFESSAGTISSSALTGLSLDMGLSVTVSGTLDVIFNEVAQDLTTWNSIGLRFYTSSDYDYSSEIGESNFEALTGGTENWSVILPAQSPETVIYAAFIGWDENDEEIRDMDAGTITLGSTPLTNQVLTVEQGMVTVSGTLSGTLNGAPMDPSDIELFISFYEDIYGNEHVGNASVAATGDWSLTIPKYETETDIYYIIVSQTLEYMSAFDAAKYIPVQDIDINNQAISLDIVEISGTLTAGTDVSGFGAVEEWSFYGSEDESTLFYAIMGGGVPVADGTWSAYTEAPETGTKDYHLGFHGTSETDPLGTLYQSVVTVGQSAVADVDIEFSELSTWGCNISGNLSVGLSGVDFNDGYELYLLNSTILEESSIAGFSGVAPDGSYSAQIYQDSSAYDVWYILMSESGAWLSDNPVSLGSGDTTGVNISIDDMTQVDL